MNLPLFICYLSLYYFSLIDCFLILDFSICSSWKEKTRVPTMKLNSSLFLSLIIDLSLNPMNSLSVKVIWPMRVSYHLWLGSLYHHPNQVKMSKICSVNSCCSVKIILHRGDYYDTGCYYKGYDAGCMWNNQIQPIFGLKSHFSYILQADIRDYHWSF